MKIEPVKGYIPQPGQEWKTVQGGHIAFFNKDGKAYFVKRFHTPVYPNPQMKEPFRTNKLKECNEFVDTRNEIIRTLKKVAPGTGNIITPIELFMDNSRYYQTSMKVEDLASQPSEIARWSRDEIFLFLTTILTSIEKVHNSGIVHGDLKPDNIMVSKSRIGKKVSKIIDFDDSYFQGRPPLPSLTVGTPEYYSPELYFYKRTLDEETDKVAERAKMITPKSDIFALGVIFWEYLSGKKPEIDGNNIYFALVNKIKSGDTSPIIPRNSKLAIEEFRPLLEEMMSFSPNQRPTTTEVLARIRELQNPPRRTKPVPQPHPVPVPEPQPVPTPRPVPEPEPKKRLVYGKALPAGYKLEETRNPNKVKIINPDGKDQIVDLYVLKKMNWVE